jgi:hypothetical protein
MKPWLFVLRAGQKTLLTIVQLLQCAAYAFGLAVLAEAIARRLVPPRSVRRSILETPCRPVNGLKCTTLEARNSCSACAR